jgi:hypothetical protein
MDFIKNLQLYMSEHKNEGKEHDLISFSAEAKEEDGLIGCLDSVADAGDKNVSLLLNTKFTFALTIPYKPSNTKLQNIVLPPVLLKQGLGTILRRI